MVADHGLVSEDAGLIRIVDNAYLITSPSDTTFGVPSFLATENGATGLIATDHVNGVVASGTAYGPVRATWEVLESQPPERLDVWADDGWEEVAEGGITSPDGKLSLGGASGYLHIDLGSAGEYRVRIFARGRDAASKEVVVYEPMEFHHLQFWPGPATLPCVLLMTKDQFGSAMGRSAQA